MFTNYYYDMHITFKNINKKQNFKIRFDQKSLRITINNDKNYEIDFNFESFCTHQLRKLRGVESLSQEKRK